MLRIPHCLDNRLINGGKVVSLMNWPRFMPRNIFWYSFLLETEYAPKSLVWLEGLGQLKKVNDLTGTRACYLLASSIASEPSMLPHIPSICEDLDRRKLQTEITRRMESSGMLRRVALVRTDVSEEPSASFIRVIRIGELGITLAVTSNRPILVTLMKEALSSSETSVLIRATRRNILEDAILHSHRRENLKSYTEMTRD
jgi:hypothetical protein